VYPAKIQTILSRTFHKGVGHPFINEQFRCAPLSPKFSSESRHNKYPTIHHHSICLRYTPCTNPELPLTPLFSVMSSKLKLASVKVEFVMSFAIGSKINIGQAIII